MGIRVHKMAGWGLTKWNNALRNPLRTLTDKEDNLDAYFTFIESNREEIIRCLSFDTQKITDADIGERYNDSDFNTEIQLIKAEMKRRNYRNPSNFIHQDRNVLLFQPLSQPDWFRWDDSLDWIEEHHFHGAKNRTQILKTGIWPHDHWMVRFRDPSEDMIAEFQANPEHNLPGYVRVDDKGIVALATGEWNRFVGRWDPKQLPLQAGERFMHFKKDFRPVIPVGVIMLALWSGMAKEPERFFNALRPMIRVWWD